MTMIKLHEGGVFWADGRPTSERPGLSKEAGALKTMAAEILLAHNGSNSTDELRLKFDSLISHDITYVGIIQTARASGLEEFPIPYVMTNCHNSLCAVGGTINEDDHVFGLSAAKRYGGIYVPANQAVIHQYAREMMAGCGRMILGSDSHTRYGALGTLGVGEGGPELVKQLLSRTYDISRPQVVLVYLTGTPRRGTGPHDVAIALCGATYKNNFVKNKILEFAGPGVKDLPMDFRIGIDVMTTETACLSSIWVADERVQEYLAAHGRADEYRSMQPTDGAYYDAMIEIDLGTIEPMAALPFHPSEACTIAELKANAGDMLREAERRARDADIDIDLTSKLVNGKIVVDQGIIAGCAGGMYDNIAEAAAILHGGSVGDGYFSLSVYPSSVPVNIELVQSGVQLDLLQSGALFKPCFCGPCFGAGDVPSCGGLSARHTTRNFPSREGSKPSEGQTAAVMLMDSRSIAATARNKGMLTGADEVEYTPPAQRARTFDADVYGGRVYFGFGKADTSAELRLGPNIAEWPKIPSLGKHILLRLDAVIFDPVTTTDELIPSGDASSYRSNPLKMAEFTLSRRDPGYVARAKETRAMDASDARVRNALSKLGVDVSDVQIGSAIFARKPGDGSAREQAASCQRILGGAANICYDFATKRYRSNCINWGILPFTLANDVDFKHSVGAFVFVPNVRDAVTSGASELSAHVIDDDGTHDITLHLPTMTDEERRILAAGCLMNFYAEEHADGR